MYRYYMLCLFILKGTCFHGDVKYVRLGGNLLLKCSTSNSNSVTWRHKELIYSVGSNVNNVLAKSGKIEVQGNHTKGEYHLMIKKVTYDDEGLYWCVFSDKGHVTDIVFDVKIMVPPTNLAILNQTRHMIYGDEGMELELICKVTSGYPREELSWYSIGLLLMNGSGTIRYTFIPEYVDHLKIFICRADHKALDTALEESVQLILTRKPMVRLTVQPSNRVFVGSNVTLWCKIDNLLDLTDIVWTKNNQPIHHRTTYINLNYVTLSDNGTYICQVENRYGRSYANQTLFVLEHDDERNCTTAFYPTSTLETTEGLSIGKGFSFQKGIIPIGLTGIIIIHVLLVMISAIIILWRRRKVQQHTIRHIIPNPTDENETSSNNTDNLNNGYEEVDEINMIAGEEILLPTNTQASHKSQSSSSGSDNVSMKSSEASVNTDGYLNPYTSLVGKSRNSDSPYEKCQYKQKSVWRKTI